MKKIIISLFIFISIFFGFTQAKALTVEDIDFLVKLGFIDINLGNYAKTILGLVKKVIPEKEILVSTPTVSCLYLKNNMTLGSKDSDTNGEVTLLQDYLRTSGYLKNISTGYYGALTQSAIISFQKANGISPTGYAGLYTRSKIRELTCKNVPETKSVSANLVAVSTSTTASTSTPTSTKTTTITTQSIILGGGGGGGGGGGSAAPISPTPTKADLVPSAISQSTSTIVASTTITFSSSITNSGGTNAGIFVYKWYVNDIETKAGSSTGISAGVTYSTTSLNYIWTAVVGTSTIKFCVDTANTVDESNESNNCLTKIVGVSSPSSISTKISTSTFYNAIFNPTQVFGQIDIYEMAFNTIVANKGFKVSGVHVDTSKTPNVIYVADNGNNRILGFNGIGSCSSGGAVCTIDSDCGSGNTCVNNPNKTPTLIFGQTASNKGACNGDAVTLGKTPTASTLCPFGASGTITSPAETGNAISMTTDAQGNLYYPDIYNNRVLKFNDPFSTDTVADEVWGQANFISNLCNRGGSIGANTLCLPSDDHAGTGVDVDSSGNVWVSDTNNFRVLRFPAGSKTADLVLGQTSLTNRSADGCAEGAGLDKLCRPGVLKFYPNGDLYVLDQHIVNRGEGQTRILVFKPPFSTGMTATKSYNAMLSYIPGQNDTRSFGFGRDPSGQGDTWIGFFTRAYLVNASGTPIAVIGASDLDPTSNIPYNFSTYPSPFIQTFGEIGVDSGGNIYFPNDNVNYPVNGVTRFSTPVSTSTMPQPNASLLGYTPNQLDNSSFRDPFGIAVWENQLIVNAGNNRIYVYDNYLSKGNKPQADYVLSSANGFDAIGVPYVDKQNRLWIPSNSRITVYQLPITSSTFTSPPLKNVYSGTTIKWADDNTPVTFFPKSLAYDSDHDALWIGDPSSKILRVSGFFGANPKVDLVIGQRDKNFSCNLSGHSVWEGGYGNHNADPSYICLVSYLTLDNYNNLYVVDSSYEGGGNTRIARFDYENTIPVSGNLFPLPAASKLYSLPASPTYVSFNKDNIMVVSGDSYLNPQHQRMAMYYDPSDSTAPTRILDFPFGQAGGTVFDKYGNLLVQDHTWNRIILYNNPFGQSLGFEKIKDFATVLLSRIEKIATFENIIIIFFFIAVVYFIDKRLKNKLK